MKTHLQFRNFASFEHLKEFVEDTLDQSVGKFETSREFDVHLIVESLTHSSTLGHHPVFACEVIVSGTNAHRPIVVKKTSSDFYRVVRSCVKAAEKTLRRSSKIWISERRRKNIHPIKQQTEFDKAY